MGHLKNNPGCKAKHSSIDLENLKELDKANKKQAKKLRDAAAYKAKNEDTVQVMSQLF